MRSLSSFKFKRGFSALKVLSGSSIWAPTQFTGTSSSSFSSFSSAAVPAPVPWALTAAGTRRACSPNGVASLSRFYGSLAPAGEDGPGAYGRRERKGKDQVRDRPFVDQIRVHVTGGRGGDGCASVRKSRQSRKGRPDGGAGAPGGHVYLEASLAVRHLAGVPLHVKGGNGGPGGTKKQGGRRGGDVVIKVPVGTVVRLLEGRLDSSAEEEEGEEEESEEGEADDDLSSHAHPHLHSHSHPHAHTRLQLHPQSYPHPSNPFPLNPHPQSQQQQQQQQQQEEEEEEGEQLLPSAKEEEKASEDQQDENDEEQDSSDGESADDDGLEEETQAGGGSGSRGGVEIADLSEEGSRLQVAVGGQGGRGNVAMGRQEVPLQPGAAAATAEARGRAAGGKDEHQRRAVLLLPSADCERGAAGSRAVLQLELKLVADVGLVGAPNAGKSTLLGALSRARPRVASYAFTTLAPQIGSVRLDAWSAFTVADIPGLIEGAHANRGLGHAFLRHVERTRALAYVLDMAPPRGAPAPWRQLASLRAELEQYKPGLSARPALVVANKMDEDVAGGNLQELLEWLRDGSSDGGGSSSDGGPLRVYPVCAVLEEGVPELKRALRDLVLDTHPHAVAVAKLGDGKRMSPIFLFANALEATS
eukprot:jgi/Mesen1/10952/ME000096S10530